MIIRYISTNNIEDVLDVVLRDLIRKNISYVVIKNPLDLEIHFDKYIYHIFPFEISKEFIELEPLLNIKHESDIYRLNKKFDFKEKTGYKRYTKKEIKRGNVRLPK